MGRDGPHLESVHHSPGNLNGYVLLGLHGAGPQVRRADDVRPAHQGVARGGLLTEHVQGSLGDDAGVERAHQRLVIDDPAARHIDHPRPLLHLGKGRVTKDALQRQGTALPVPSTREPLTTERETGTRCFGRVHGAHTLIKHSSSVWGFSR